MVPSFHSSLETSLKTSSLYLGTHLFFQSEILVPERKKKKDNENVVWKVSFKLSSINSFYPSHDAERLQKHKWLCVQTKYFAFGKMNDQTYSPYDYKGQVV